MYLSDPNAKFSTACGTFLSVLVYLQTKDLLATVVLAALGGTASFVATTLAKHIWQFLKNRFRK